MKKNIILATGIICLLIGASGIDSGNPTYWLITTASIVAILFGVKEDE